VHVRAHVEVPTVLLLDGTDMGVASLLSLLTIRVAGALALHAWRILGHLHHLLVSLDGWSRPTARAG